MNKLIDIEAMVRSFYGIQCLEIMSKEGFIPFMPSHEKWEKDLSQYSRKLEKKLSNIIYDYIVKVVASELRHSRLKSEFYLSEFYGSIEAPNFSREDVWDDCTKYNPSEIIKAGLFLFNEENNLWDDGYGGDAWYQIAKGGSFYHKIPDRVFIDHTVDLSHNNSIFFDKKAGIFSSLDTDRYCYFLNTKMIESPRVVLGEVIPMANQDFLDLYLRGINLGILKEDLRLEDKAIFNRFRKAPFIRHLREEKYDALFNYSPIKWGNKTLNLNNLKYGWKSDECTDVDYECDEEGDVF